MVGRRPFRLLLLVVALCLLPRAVRATSGNGPTAVDDYVEVFLNEAASAAPLENDVNTIGTKVLRRVDTPTPNVGFWAVFESLGIVSFLLEGTPGDPSVFTGTVTFNYVMSSGLQGASAAYIRFFVHPMQGPPDPNGHAYEIPEDSTLTFSLPPQNEPTLCPDPQMPGTVDLSGENGNIVVFRPNQDWFGFTYLYWSARDMPECSALVNITVTPVNDPPVAQDDTCATVAGVAVDCTVLDNDSDIDVGDTLVVASVGAASGGTTSVSTDGQKARFVPSESFSGVTTFTYVCSDGNGGTATATVTVTVDARPVAVDDSYTFVEGVQTTLDTYPMANDYDPEGSALTLLAVGTATSGSATVSLGAAGLVQYTPTNGYKGDDSFTYTISDGFSSAVGTVSISYDGPPIANDVYASTNQDVAIIVDVLASASSPSGRALSISSVGVPNNGSAVVTSGQVRYTPDPGFAGDDSFSYTVTDGQTATAIIYMTVTNTNEAPEASDTTATTPEDTPIVVDVVSLATDADGDTITLDEVKTAPAHGSTTLVAGGVRYAPDANFNGQDSFTYTVKDTSGAVSNEGTVTVTVTPVNDAPVANNATATTPEDTFVDLDVVALATDVEGQVISVNAVESQPTHGSAAVVAGEIRYSPDLNFNGQDSFTFTVKDASGAVSNTSTATITVTPVNDGPSAVPLTFYTTEDVVDFACDVLANATDPEGDSLSVSAVTQPSQGGAVSISGDGKKALYTPARDWSGTETFLFTVSDGWLTDTATATVVVSPVNDAPQAGDLFETTSEDTALSVFVLTNSTDVDGDSLSVASIEAQPLHGSASISATEDSILYTPSSNYNGPDFFQFKVKDTSGATSNTATVHVQVTPVNDAPVANDATDTTPEDVAIVVDVVVLATDPENDAIFVNQVESSPAHGSTTVVSGGIQYTPDSNYNGQDTFTYTVKDASGAVSNTATVTITVTPENDPPLANGIARTLKEDSSANINLLQAASDPEGDALSVNAFGQPSHGSVSVFAGSVVTYTPEADYHGSDSFTYSVKDTSNAVSNTATVTLTITPEQDAPVVYDQLFMMLEDVVNFECDVLWNATDADGDAISIKAFTQPLQGTITVASDRSKLFYTPARHFFGEEFFYFTATDTSNLTAVATVFLVVLPVNDPPDALGTDEIAIATQEDTPVTIDVLATVTDPDPGDVLTIASLTKPAHGSVAVVDDKVVYTPDVNYFGVDTFEFTATDGQLNSTSAIVTVTVHAVNDRPMAGNTSFTVPEDAVGFECDVLSQTVDVEGDTLTITSVTQPAHGVATISGAKVLYSPAANYHGPDAFTFTVSDGALTATATALLTITSVNDAPVAVDDAVICIANSHVAVSPLDNDADPDGDDVTLVGITAQPASGSASIVNTTKIVYTPVFNFLGQETIQYRIGDGRGGFAEATITVTVVGGLTAFDDSATTPEDTAVSIHLTANDLDAEGDGLVLVSTTTPAHGIITVFDASGGRVTYLPNKNYFGSDSFSYTVRDSANNEASATVAVTVTAVNDKLLAVDDAYNVSMTRPGQPSTEGFTIFSVLDNDSDLDGDDIKLVSMTQPPNGVAGADLNTGKVAYRPNVDFVGVDSFTYTSTDGVETAAATVRVSVTPLGPVLLPDTYDMLEDGGVLVAEVLINDTSRNGTSLHIVSATAPSHGTVTIAASGDSLTYRPDMNFNGEDQFTYRASDGQFSSSASVTVRVAAVNDAPKAVDDTCIVIGTAAVTCNVLENDSDVDGDELEILSVQAPQNGSAQVASDKKSISYTPDPSYHGFENMIYQIWDGKQTASAVLTVSVGDAPPEPMADEFYTTVNVGTLLSVLTNDTDPDGDELSVVAVSQPVNGVASIWEDLRRLYYEPATDFVGDDVFQYTVTDGLFQRPATVTVHVRPESEAPGVQDDQFYTEKGRVADLDVLGNDAGGLWVRATELSSVFQGTITISDDGGTFVTYTPPSPTFTGLEVFQYMAVGATGRAWASVRVQVGQTGVDQPPVANDDEISVEYGSTEPVTKRLGDNDADPDGDILRFELDASASPTHGQASLASHPAQNRLGLVTYTPSSSTFNGVDTFDYSVSDGRGGTDSARVYVYVGLHARDDVTTTYTGVPIAVRVLDNDFGHGGVISGIAEAPLRGSATVRTTASPHVIEYTPPAAVDWVGEDSFRYTISADGGSREDTATVRVSVEPNPGNVTAVPCVQGAFDGSSCLCDSGWAGDTCNNCSALAGSAQSGGGANECEAPSVQERGIVLSGARTLSLRAPFGGLHSDSTGAGIGRQLRLRGVMSEEGDENALWDVDMLFSGYVEPGKLPCAADDERLPDAGEAVCDKSPLKFRDDLTCYAPEAPLDTLGWYFYLSLTGELRARGTGELVEVRQQIDAVPQAGNGANGISAVHGLRAAFRYRLDDGSEDNGELTLDVEDACKPPAAAAVGTTIIEDLLWLWILLPVLFCFALIIWRSRKVVKEREALALSKSRSRFALADAIDGRGGNTVASDEEDLSVFEDMSDADSFEGGVMGPLVGSSSVQEGVDIDDVEVGSVAGSSVAGGSAAGMGGAGADSEEMLPVLAGAAAVGAGAAALKKSKNKRGDIHNQMVQYLEEQNISGIEITATPNKHVFMFGHKRIQVKLQNDKDLLVRVGGGYIAYPKFVDDFVRRGKGSKALELAKQNSAAGEDVRRARKR